MNSIVWKKIAINLVIFLSLAAAFLLMFNFAPFKSYDPDTYYHFAVSRAIAENGFLNVLPQVEDLGWGKYYPDKSFVLHYLGAFAYKIAQDKGVVYFCIALAILAYFLIFRLARHFLPRLQALLLILPLGFFYFPFFSRMILVRSHLLSINAFVFLLLGLLKQNPYAVLAASAIFSLCYHAFYIPIFVILVFLSIFYWENRSHFRLVLFGLAGVLIGILIHPYFPANLEMTLLHLQIALKMGLPKDLNIGMELRQIPVDLFFNRYFPSFLLVFSAIALPTAQKYLLKGSIFKNDDQKVLSWLLLTNAIFLFLLAGNQRSIEYVLPLNVLLYAFLLSKINLKPILKIVSLFAVFFVVLLLKRDFFQQSAEIPADVENNLSIIDYIPKEEAGAKIFHCEWDSSPYILYKRPDLRFVDILDPNFLYKANPPLFAAREALIAGSVTDPWAMIRLMFKADYVLCRNSTVKAQLLQNPNFELIQTPLARKYSPYEVPMLFRVKKTTAPNFVYSFQTQNVAKNFEISMLDSLKGGEWKSKIQLMSQKPLILSHYQNFAHTNTVAANRCLLLKPEIKNQKLLQSADYLAIGGGAKISLWSGGRLIYEKSSPSSVARLVSSFIPMRFSMRNAADLVLKVCPRPGEPWGLALSFWNQEELNKFCDARNLVTKDKLNWKYQGIIKRNCIAPIATLEKASMSYD